MQSKFHTFKLSGLALVFALSHFALYTPANASDNVKSLTITSTLLATAQCELLLPGFRDKIWPYYQAWRKANIELIKQEEASNKLADKIKKMKYQLPKLSQKASQGAKKDCAALLTQMAMEFPQQ